MIIQTGYEIGDYIRIEGYGDVIYNIINATIEVDYDNDAEELYADVMYFCEDIAGIMPMTIACEEDVIDDVTDDAVEAHLSKVDSIPRLFMDIDELGRLVADKLAKNDYGVAVEVSKPYTDKQAKINEQLTIIADYLGLINMFGEDVTYRKAIEKAEGEINRILKE